MSVVARQPRALSVLVAFAIALAALVVVAQVWTTDFGFDERIVSSTRLVSVVDRGGAADRAGVAIGDEIVQDPGRITFRAPWTEREAYEWNYLLHRALQSGRVPITLRRDGAEREVVIVPDPAPNLPAALRQLRRFGSQLPVSIAFLGVALLLVRRTSASPRDDQARRVVAASFACLGPAWLVAWPMPAWPLWLYPVSSLLEVFGPAIGITLLAYFAWSYPTRARFVDAGVARFVVLAAGIPCTLFACANSMHLIAAPNGLHGNTASILFDTALAIVTAAGLVWQRRRAPDRVAKRQATMLLLFCGVGMFVPILLLLIPQYVFGGAPPILHLLLLPFPLLIPIGFAAVVTRYRLFSLDGLAWRAGPYAIAIVTSMFVFVAIAAFVETILPSAGTTDAGRWLGMIFALIVIEPLRRASRVLVDRVFAWDRKGFLRTCSGLAANVARIGSVDEIEVAVRSALEPKAAEVVVLGALFDASAAHSVATALGEFGAVQVVDLPSPDAVDVFTRRGIELLVDLPGDVARGEAKLALALTLPVAAAHLDRNERDALALVGRVAGAALSRATLERSLEDERARAEEERRQIAMELHDGLGAALTAARTMTRRLRDPSNGAVEGTLEALEQTLRDGLGDLRASLWGLDPTDATWEALIAKVRRNVGDHCAAAGITFTMRVEGTLDARVAPAGRLAILRVIQEAVNNAVKHASPRNVDVRLAVTSEAIDVAIEDDGVWGTPAAEGGRGLGNMTRRIESLDGSFRLESVEGGGTRVAMSLPARAFALRATV